MKRELRRLRLYLAAAVVAAGAALAGLPWTFSVAIAAISLFAGAATAWSPRVAIGSRSRSGRRSEAAHAPTMTAIEPSFRCEGEYWAISYTGETFRLHDAKGLRYIHRLLTTPDVEVHARDLAPIDLGGGTSARARPREDQLSVGSNPDPVLDRRAREELGRRVEDLRDQIDEAEANADDERAARARAELEFILGELHRQIRPGGASRSLGDETERARVNVTRAIQASIGKIRQHDPALAHHLDREIRTGTYCCYSPPPGSAPAWRL